MSNKPQEIQRMKELVRLLQACSILDDHYDLEFLHSQIDAASWGWDPKFESMPTEQIDRTGDVFNGPVFTCEGYEWPIHADLPMNPIIQLDLGRCSEVTGQDFGSGLLQVWEGFGLLLGKEAFLRVIPADIVKARPLLPIPFFDMGLWKQWVTIASMDWVEAMGRTEGEYADIKPIQIVGYEEKRFTVPYIYKVSKECKKSVLKKFSEECIEKIKELDSLIQFGQKHWHTGTHLLGTFSAIQYWPSERPTPLFCFASDDTHGWGDMGNGQIFMKRKENGEIQYFLDWSCS